MIQRIQSIFLFIAAAVGFAALFLPMSHFYGGFKYPVDLQALFAPENQQFTISGIILKIGALLSLVAIFLFKNRKNQILLTRISQAFVFIWMAYAIYCFYPFSNFETFKKDALNIMGNYLQKHFAFLFPLLMLLFNFLAIKFIKKDEALIRSMDRLR